MILLILLSTLCLAEEAKFNNFDNDYPSLLIANRTSNPDNYQPVMYAQPGDVLCFRFYVHNTMVDVLATNTKVFLELVNDGPSLKTFQSTIKADNANKVVSVAQVYSDQPFELTLLPGTTQRFTFLDNGEMKNETLMDFSLGEWYLLGDILGCWQYVNYLTVQMEVK